MDGTERMFNLLVTAVEGAWEDVGYEFSRSRFLEYTSEDVAESFRELKEPQLQALKDLPCLFAYEGKKGEVYLGCLNNIELRDKGRTIFIEPFIDRSVRPLSFEQIEHLRSALDIRDWEVNRTHWAIKQPDLHGIFNGAGFYINKPAPAIVTVAELPPASEPEFKAESVGRFIEHILALDHGGKEVFYRGHSNRKKYRLEPSIFRKDKDGNFVHRHSEDRLYRELLVSNSADFAGDVYTLDRLVRMQHYSLPTRLLDITSNPLIALYFACKNHLDEEGELIVFSMDRERIKYFDSDTASCIANLARINQQAKDSIDYDSSEIHVFNDQRSLKQLLHVIKEEKPFFEGEIIPQDLKSIICVKGKHANNRIAFQSGAFLLFGHDATLDEAGNDEISVHRISVGEKRLILRQLDKLNINESTLFPYIESSAKYIADKFLFREPDA